MQTSLATRPKPRASAYERGLTSQSTYANHRGSDTTYLLLYVDDIVLTASSARFLQHIIVALQHEFAMTDMGQLHHFLGVSIARCDDGLFLS